MIEWLKKFFGCCLNNENEKELKIEASNIIDSNRKKIYLKENIENLKFGIEIEMIKDKKEVERIVTKTINGKLDIYDYLEYEIPIYAIRDDKGRYWRIEKDDSIKGKENEQTELISPILTKEDIPILKRIVEELRKEGAISIQKKSCGVHIHVGAENLSTKELIKLANIMKEKENELLEFVNVPSIRQEKYCQKADKSFIEKINKGDVKTKEELLNIWYGSESERKKSLGIKDKHRYKMLNFSSLQLHNTVEFRFLGFNEENNLDKEVLEKYIWCVLEMVSEARSDKSFISLNNNLKLNSKGKRV